MSRAQIALAWLLHQPAVTAPIVGVTRTEHLTDALAAVELHLDPEELGRLEERSCPTRRKATRARVEWPRQHMPEAPGPGARRG